MYDSIGEVSRKTGITVSTLRFYDKEGLFPNMKRSSGGIRMFSGAELETIRVIECLKSSGLSIKEIRQFLDWCQQGDSSLQKRRDMFHERRAVVTKQMEELQKTMDMIRYKCWYYDTALAAGTESAVKSRSAEELPAEICALKKTMEAG